jgi:hypothetical protein
MHIVKSTEFEQEMINSRRHFCCIYLSDTTAEQDIRYQRFYASSLCPLYTRSHQSVTSDAYVLICRNSLITECQMCKPLAFRQRKTILYCAMKHKYECIYIYIYIYILQNNMYWFSHKIICIYDIYFIYIIQYQR